MCGDNNYDDNDQKNECNDCPHFGILPPIFPLQLDGLLLELGRTLLKIVCSPVKLGYLLVTLQYLTKTENREISLTCSHAHYQRGKGGQGPKLIFGSMKTRDLLSKSPTVKNVFPLLRVIDFPSSQIIFLPIWPHCLITCASAFPDHYHEHVNLKTFFGPPPSPNNERKVFVEMLQKVRSIPGRDFLLTFTNLFYIDSHDVDHLADLSLSLLEPRSGH